MSTTASPRRLTHVNLFVRDIEFSTAFYSDIAGFHQVFEEKELRATFLGNGSTSHDLALMEVTAESRPGRDGHIQVKSGQGRLPGLNHLGFEMATESDLVGSYQHLIAQGVRIERTTDHQITHSVYFRDPSGNMLELYVDAVSDWRELFERSRGKLISGHWEPDPRHASMIEHYDRDPVVAAPDKSVLQPSRINSVAIGVRDLARAVDFYTDAVGLGVVSVETSAGIAVLRGANGTGYDVVLASGGGRRRGLFYISFDATPRIDWTDARDVLRQQRIDARDLAELQSDVSGGVLVHDPDGLPLIFSDPTDSTSHLKIWRFLLAGTDR